VPSQLPEQVPNQLPLGAVQQGMAGGVPPPYAGPTLQQQRLEEQQPTQLAQNPYPHAPSAAPETNLPCKPWHLMNEAEQLNYLARQKRDGFLDRLFTNIDEGLNNRQFWSLPAFNELEDRERAADALYGKDSMATHTKDRYENWQSRYF
jgi:hypothetical protein